MPELALSVKISRGSLGLAPLQVNDHDAYYISNNDFLGGQVAYNRQQASSPFMDGAVTTFRNKQMVSHNMTIEVMGETYAIMRQALEDLTAAFSQDYFTLEVIMGTGLDKAVFSYRGEAADYNVRHDGPRWIAHQIQMQFQVPCQPLPNVGLV